MMVTMMIMIVMIVMTITMMMMKMMMMMMMMTTTLINCLVELFSPLALVASGTSAERWRPNERNTSGGEREFYTFY